MAQEEIIFRLKVDAGDSASKVNDVDKEFDSLRQSIKDTEKEVEKLSKQFGDNSKEADAARKNLAKLNLAYEDLSRAATDVNAKFEEVYGELQPLTTRLGEAEDRLYELALAGKQNTKEYQDLLETVARYRQTQIETDRVVDNAAQTFSQKLGSAIQGAASGFQLVQGASALFGEESEELEKTLLKVQSAMALADGIEGVRQALPMFSNFANTIKTKVVTAFSSLKGAIMSTGIGALVVAIGYLISNFDKLKGVMSSGLTSAKNFETSTTQQGEAARYASDNFAEYERTLRRLGLTEEEISNKRKARFKDAIDKTQKEIAASKEVYKEQLKNLKTVETFDKWGLNATGRLLFGDEEDAKAQQQKIKDLSANLTKLRNDQFEYNQKIKEDRKKDNEDADKKQAEANEKARERRKQNLEDIRQNKIKQQEIENQRISEQETLENAYYDSFKTQQELEEQAVRDKYFTIIQTTKDNETLKLAQQKELDAIAKKYKDATDKEENDRQNNLADKYEEYYNEYYDATTAAYQKEQDAVNAKYFYLIEKAKEYGLSTVELEKKRVEELDKIQTPQKQALQDFKDLYGELSTAIQTSTEIDLNNLKSKHSGELELLKENYGEKENYAELEYGLKMRQYNEEKAIIERQRAFAEFQKKIAIVQTTIDTAKALSSTISGATQAAASGGPAAPFLLAGYIASGIATVTTAYAKVKTLLNAPMPSIQAPKMPREMKDGGTGDGTQGTQQTIQAQSTYKVVVVDSDITKMQDKTKKVNAISTI